MRARTSTSQDIRRSRPNSPRLLAACCCSSPIVASAPPLATPHDSDHTCCLLDNIVLSSSFLCLLAALACTSLRTDPGLSSQKVRLDVAAPAYRCSGCASSFNLWPAWSECRAAVRPALMLSFRLVSHLNRAASWSLLLFFFRKERERADNASLCDCSQAPQTAQTRQTPAPPPPDRCVGSTICLLLSSTTTSTTSTFRPFKFAISLSAVLTFATVQWQVSLFAMPGYEN